MGITRGSQLLCGFLMRQSANSARYAGVTSASMRDFETAMAGVFVGHERVSSGEIRRRALASDAPSIVVAALDGLPAGEYTLDEVVDALDQVAVWAVQPATGIPPGELSTDLLIRELGQLHRTRDETFRHGSTQALDEHNARTAAVEAEYLLRFPEREVDEQRTRSGARARVVRGVTGPSGDGGV